MLQKNNGYESGVKLTTHSKGFSLIEILIAVALVGLMAVVVIPNLGPQHTRHARKDFVSSLNALMTMAWEHAIVKQRTHRLWFDVQKNLVEVQVDTGKKETDGTAVFKVVDSGYLRPSYAWDEHLQIKDFFIEGSDEIHRHRKASEVWFFVVPDGLTQEVIINVFDTRDTTESAAGTRMGLVLNPFTAKFIQHATFQYP